MGQLEQLQQFAARHWELSAAFMVIILLIYVNEWITLKKSAQVLSPQLAVKKMNHDDAVVIDLRDQEAFSAGHIINAIRIDPAESDKPKMAKYKAKPIILVCSSGNHSRTLAPKLKSNGFTDVMVLAGGLSAWQSAGLPIVKGNK